MATAMALERAGMGLFSVAQVKEDAHADEQESDA
jgi:hypothetical protein